MTASRAEKQLSGYLRVLGIITMTAVFAVVMPFHWMDAISGWLTGWGMPNTPVINYLARGLSLMYVFFGVMVFRLSFSPSRHLEILKFLGQAGVIFGIAMTALDPAIGLPWQWTLAEGPATILINLLLLYLVRRVWRED